MKLKVEISARFTLSHQEKNGLKKKKKRKSPVCNVQDMLKQNKPGSGTLCASGDLT